MDNDLAQRARWGDLAGQNWAGLVRLSFEVDEGPATAGDDATGSTDAKPAFRPMTGRDIRSRDEQEKDNRSFVESRGGRYKARAAARMGDGRLVRESLDAGRARLDRLPRPDHPEHHFIIDPDKWDFYEMDAYRLLGDDERAATHARSVIRISTGPDGTEISPMRAAEARLTLGVAAARMGEIEEAIGMGTTALEADRKSLPSLLLVADELDKELRARYPREAASRDFHERITTIKRGAVGPELPFCPPSRAPNRHARVAPFDVRPTPAQDPSTHHVCMERHNRTS
ncbi:hypothetical protein [Streptomyces mirabilis]|uniref:hypothetical protein n=1 Tax=Streptomyces mirabilis TaxID=68239 RepID=UPI003320F36F